nr:hypothetical protein [Cytophagales bacterium]
MKNQSIGALNITLKRAVSPNIGSPVIEKQIEGVKRFFLGAPDSPFLAPRGVFVHGTKLMVSDTGQNRVFIWNELPTEHQQKPDLVIGQDDAVATGRNSGGNASSHSLQYPSAVWSDGHCLLVADAWNHRVLIWNSYPTAPNQAADVVLGQDDFSGNLPNKVGVNASASASSLYWPYGLTVHNGTLFVADTGNRRVLVYKQIPSQSGASADYVIGQEDFQSRTYNSTNAIWPYSVALGPKGELAITDTQYYRVLMWEHWESALTKPAAYIIGQPSFEANGQNQFGLHPRQHTLSWCYSTGFFRNGLFVGDTGNSRILWFENLPSSHGAVADSLLGKPDFFTGSEFADTVFGTEKSLYWPFSFSVTPEEQLVIADTGNHRIVIVDLLMPAKS